MEDIVTTINGEKVETVVEYPLPSTEIRSYPYKIVVIVNEYTQSQAEDHTFFTISHHRLQ